MKLATLFLALALAAIPAQFIPFPSSGNGGGAGAAPIQSCNGASASGPTNCTLSGVGANHLLVVMMWGYNNFGVTPISDTFGLSWTLGAQCSTHRGGPADDYLVYAWAYTGASTGSDTITVTPVSIAAVDALEYNTGHTSGGPETDGCSTGSTVAGGTTNSVGPSSLLHTLTAHDLIIVFGETGDGSLHSGTLSSYAPDGFVNAGTFFQDPTGGIEWGASAKFAGVPGFYAAVMSQAADATQTNIWIGIGTAFKY